MENKIAVFDNDEFGEVRAIIIKGEPYFVGKDVAKILGYSNPQKALRDHVDEEDRTVNESFIVNGTMATLINESGLYSLILRCQLPSAKSFKRWVTSEILPSIRKHGGYFVGQEKMADAELMAQAMLTAKQIIAEKDQRIEEMESKAEFYDAVADCKDALDFSAVAKMLNYPGIGRNNLIKLLRKHGVLMPSRNSKDIVPYQKWVDKGYFRTIEQRYDTPFTTHIRVKTLVYQSGVDAIRKFLQKLADRHLI